VSEDPARGATKIHATKGSGPSGGNSGTKWLIGAAAAVVLAGGGYYAYQNYGPAQDNSQLAYTDTYGDDAVNDPSARADSAATADESVASSASTNTTPRARRTTAPAASDIPTETIGISSTDEPTTDSDEIVVTGAQRPVWANTPSQRRLSALYPPRALERGREGEASLSCMVEAGGRLDCTRVSETAGGFGSAALRVANTLRHAPQRADGSDATGTPVNLRVVFRMADEERRG